MLARCSMSPERRKTFIMAADPPEGRGLRGRATDGWGARAVPRGRASGTRAAAATRRRARGAGRRAFLTAAHTRIDLKQVKSAAFDALAAWYAPPQGYNFGLVHGSEPAVRGQGHGPGARGRACTMPRCVDATVQYNYSRGWHVATPSIGLAAWYGHAPRGLWRWVGDRTNSVHVSRAMALTVYLYQAEVILTAQGVMQVGQ